jgi:hypothetical protein
MTLTNKNDGQRGVMSKSALLGGLFIGGLFAIVVMIPLVHASVPGVATNGVSPLVSLRGGN